jgi:hypothetical protein
LKDLFNEAEADPDSFPCCNNGLHCYFFEGIKIVKCSKTGEIKIFNTHKGGQFYKELSDEELTCLYRHGWKRGCFVIILKSNRRKIEAIEAQLRTLPKTNGNENLIKKLIETKKKRIEFGQSVWARRNYYLNPHEITK